MASTTKRWKIHKDPEMGRRESRKSAGLSFFFLGSLASSVAVKELIGSGLRNLRVKGQLALFRATVVGHLSEQ